MIAPATSINDRPTRATRPSRLRGSHDAGFLAVTSALTRPSKAGLLRTVPSAAGAVLTDTPPRYRPKGHQVADIGGNLTYETDATRTMEPSVRAPAR